MENNINQSPNDYEEIDLKEIIKILLESKKLIISTMLIFTIASIIYSLSLKTSFLSSANLEIGYSYEENGSKDLIESPSDLISDIKIQLLRNPDSKFSQNVAINSLEGKAINLKTTSISAEQNESFLTEIISYIDKRHSNLSLLKNNFKTSQISLNLETVNSKIAAIKEKQILDTQDRLNILSSELLIIDLEISELEKLLLDSTNNLSLLKENDNMFEEGAAISQALMQITFFYKAQINTLNRKKSSNTQEIKSLNNHLKFFEKNMILSDRFFEKNMILSDQLFSLEQNKAILENELQMLMNQTQVSTSLIGNIETKTIKPKTLSIILSMGIILGFITSILLVFIRNFVKSYKESKA